MLTGDSCACGGTYRPLPIRVCSGRLWLTVYKCDACSGTLAR